LDESKAVENVGRNVYRSSYNVSIIPFQF